MKWPEYIDEKELRRAISVLKPNRQLFEVRIISGQGAKKQIMSGYFTEADTLIKAFDRVDVRGKNIYITLNAIAPACYARDQHDRFLITSQTTSDTEITAYQWLFVDLDPVRPAGISSSNEELRKAEELHQKVKAYLAEVGFSEPIEAISGNGYHLLYHINIPNTTENKTLIDHCLKALGMMFDTDRVKIDLTNFNQSRICKLYGTLAQKGANVPARPHRMSKIVRVPASIEITDTSRLQALADELPEEPKPTTRSRRTGSGTDVFDLVEFMHVNGLTYKEDFNDRAKIYRLDECPFDPNHKDGDAKIFQYPDGKISFKCHHNSCRNYKWQDVRLKYEPDAYDRKDDDDRYDAGYQEHLRQVQKDGPKDQTPLSAPPQKKEFRKLKTAEALIQKDIPDPVVIIGVDSELPLLVEGTCILSAKPKLGKSWLALSMCLAVANGEDFLGYHTHKCSTLYLDLETAEALQKRRILKALNGRALPKNFYLDDQTDAIDRGFVEQIEEYLKEDPEIGLVVVDVFQIIRSPSKGSKETEYEHAYRDITPLNILAQKYHIAIILVCHDRKTVDTDDPFANILGSTGLQGAATQMIVMFRQKKTDPIHISVKGKTIDGLPELNVKLENAQWMIVDAASSTSDRDILLEEYENSEIREAVLKLVETYSEWGGNCSDLINAAMDVGVTILDSNMKVGGFLKKHRPRFKEVDDIDMQAIKNGTGGKYYRFCKQTVDTVDEFKPIPLIAYRNPHEMGFPEGFL